jgi:hypothetical protein
LKFIRRNVPAARRWLLPLALAAAVLQAVAPARASVALLMEEPYGQFGAFNPTGHAAVYLNHICAVSPTQLRTCRPGELGVVISRYHKIHHNDWIAMPLAPYLYAVDDASEVPKSVTKEDVTRLREAYWRAHLQQLAPPKSDGSVPGGEWTQLVGSSFDRKIHGFEVDTTAEQDEHLIAYFNDRRNIGHFNLFFHNCADFSRAVLDIYFPHSIHRNFIADLGITTPKQVAKSLVKYGRQHPELKMSAFTILQVPGTVGRSHSVDGVAESLVKSKKYLLPLVVLQPEFAGALAAGYLSEGRLHLPKNAPVFEIGDTVPPNSEDAATPLGSPIASAAPLAPPSNDPHSNAPAAPPAVSTAQ